MQQVKSPWPFPIFKVDKKLTVIEQSSDAQRLFGQVSSLQSLLAEGSREKAASFISSEGDHGPVELYMYNKEGEMTLVDGYMSKENDLQVHLMVIEKDSKIKQVSDRLTELRKELERKNEELLDEKERAEKMLAENQRLSAPFIEVSKGVGLTPLFGEIDQDKMIVVTQHLLERANETKSKQVIIDVTALDTLDIEGVKALEKLFVSLDVMGVNVTVSGIQTEQAKSMQLMNTNASVRYISSLEKVFSYQSS
ncbi:STAS domain-containing protein [Salisediminibacterium halotolerans]|uniref:RsbT co-antagonist protein RsbR n=1 Tax=Salisediminibacterium halotolerans TaxID=517425 RepID=A0A1H9V2A6_9BACI|nr:STAS domain-containing protein [Salisediminibacterium haloalkalitolerans]SES15718.1 rsbT co-antagonist protein RsbR [Salisediminibacterium haloalkalitolerans]